MTTSKITNGSGLYPDLNVSKIQIQVIESSSSEYQSESSDSEVKINEEKKEAQEHPTLSLQDVKLQNTFKGYQKTKHSSVEQTHIVKDKLTVSKSHQNKQYALDTQVLPVNFKVILATLDAQLRNTLQTLGKQIHDYYLKRDQFQKEWKLHGNGYFINFDRGYDVCIIKKNIIYEGVIFTTAGNVILPDKKGVLIEKQGIYRGHFNRGVAEGKGQYISTVTKATYEGSWNEGVLVQGSIENDFFKFKGKFENGIAQKIGAMLFKHTQTKYNGGFKNGLFHSQKKFAKYKTKDYLYQGEFYLGKKQGKGVLDERKNKKIPKGQKYRPADQYDGEWIDDYYITKRRVRQLRKLDAVAGKQMMENMLEFIKQGSNQQYSNGQSQINQSDVHINFKTHSKIQTQQNIPLEYQYSSVRSYKDSRRKGNTDPSEINIPEEFEEDSSEDSEL